MRDPKDSRRKAVCMRATNLTCLVILICTLLPLTIQGCGKRTLTGRIVDAETGKPIEGAAVLIQWYKGGNVPGLSGDQEVDAGEDISNAEGYFKIPGHSTFFTLFQMAIYKKGYVCWSSESIFPSYKKRKNFSLKDGMVIRMEPFKESYSIEEHAEFTLHWSPFISYSPLHLYKDAIKSEKQISGETIRGERGK